MESRIMKSEIFIKYITGGDGLFSGLPREGVSGEPAGFDKGNRSKNVRGDMLKGLRRKSTKSKKNHSLCSCSYAPALTLVLMSVFLCFVFFSLCLGGFGGVVVRPRAFHL